MFSKNRKSQSGFSLVELMVVVAIIGVLASIAVPQVNKYIAKARQSEAKTILSSLYTSEKAFFAEYSAYHSMFGAIGYSPEGKLRYSAGFGAIAAANEAGAGEGYTAIPTATPGTSRTTTAYCGAAGTITNGCTILLGASGNAPATAAGTLTKTAFTAQANAVIYGTANDQWTITEQKILTNSAQGIQ